jgi:hypothetical protein
LFINCTFTQNFGVTGGLGFSEYEGSFSIIGGEYWNNIAYNVPGFEIVDSSFASSITQAFFSNNTLIDLTFVKNEIKSCTSICYIDTPYLTYF